MKAAAFEVGLRQVDASEVGCVAVRIAQIGLPQICLPQICAPQICARQVHTFCFPRRMVELLHLPVPEQQYERPFLELAHGAVIGRGFQDN